MFVLRRRGSNYLRYTSRSVVNIAWTEFLGYVVNI